MSLGQLWLDGGPHVLHDLGLLLGRKEDGDLPGVEQVVEVLQELVVRHLGVGDEEDVLRDAQRGLLQNPLQHLSPLVDPVVLGHLDLCGNVIVS